MALPEHTPAQDDPFVAADLPVDDPATVPPDEGDIGQSSDPEVVASDAQPEALLAGLTPAQLADERKFAVQAAQVALQHRSAVHYTEGPRRWDGIDRGLLGMQNHYPSYADCSSFVTWCLWNGMRIHHLPDTVNGKAWRSGNTDTQVQHGTPVDERNVLPGDLVFYGPRRGRATHVAFCLGNGQVISHGQEVDPTQKPVHYRGDVQQFRRYIGAGGGPHPRTVAEQQQAVNGLGYRPPLVVDNELGPKTKAGIKWLQRKVGATPDGIWGPDTEAKYQAYIHGHRP
jgi:cell wall-associated NlpC family hydrolase